MRALQNRGFLPLRSFERLPKRLEALLTNAGSTATGEQRMNEIRRRRYAALNLLIKKRSRLPGVTLHFPANQVAQREDHRVGNLIVNGHATALASYQLMIVEDGQVLGDVSLLHAAFLDQLAYAQRACLEGLQQCEATGL
jgi:hypothetical protein